MDKKNQKKLIGIVLSSSIVFGGVAYAQNQTNEQPLTDNTQDNKQLGTVKTTDTDQTTTAQENVTISDQELKNNVEQALQEYSGKVSVVVNNGIVFLSGKLPSDTDYERVIILTESLKGSKDVNAENLTVEDSTQPLTDTYITAKVKGMLIKTDLFDKDIPSWSIGVETKDAKVFLSGKVSSEAEKQQVLQVVQSIKQVKGIDDMIIISQDATTNKTDDTTTQTDTTVDTTKPTDTTVDETSDTTNTNTDDLNQSKTNMNNDSQNNVQQ